MNGPNGDDINDPDGL